MEDPAVYVSGGQPRKNLKAMLIEAKHRHPNWQWLQGVTVMRPGNPPTWLFFGLISFRNDHSHFSLDPWKEGCSTKKLSKTLLLVTLMEYVWYVVRFCVCLFHVHFKKKAAPFRRRCLVTMVLQMERPTEPCPLPVNGAFVLSTVLVGNGCYLGFQEGI